MNVAKIVFEAFLYALVGGFFAWVFWRALKRSDYPAKLIFKWGFTGVVVWFGFIKVAIPAFQEGGLAAIGGLSLALILSLAMAITWRHSIIDLVANPITSLWDGGKEEVEPRPFYSIANAKRKKGLPLEAILEVRKQLAKFPNDFEGVMLIATIQAEDLHDLPSAEITLNHFCIQEGALPSQVCGALTQLADWHLKLVKDNESARAALQRIVEKFPDSEYSLLASQRIAHLAKTADLLAPHDRRVYAVEHGIEDMGLLTTPSNVKPVEIPPEQQAAEYVKHLEKHPLDMEVREKLAVIYANHYRRLDLAVTELEQMIQLPNQPHKLVTHWLNLLADFQIKLAGDYNSARQTLQRLIKMFPDTAAAQVAQRRIDHLKLELKGQKESQAVKLGSYETDIGLKY